MVNQALERSVRRGGGSRLESRLRRTVQSEFDQEAAQTVIDKADSSRLQVGELAVVLLQLTSRPWKPARSAALAMVTRRPELAVGVLTAGTSDGVIPQVQWQRQQRRSSGHVVHTAIAKVTWPGSMTVRGLPKSADDQSRVNNLAALSLLAQLSELPDPTATVTAPRPAPPQAATKPISDEALCRALFDGPADQRNDLAPLLAPPGTAARILTARASRLRRPTLRYLEFPGRHGSHVQVSAQIQLEHGTLVSGARYEAARSVARDLAARSLLARLCRLEEPAGALDPRAETDPEPVLPVRAATIAPATMLNKLLQLGLIDKPQYTQHALPGAAVVQVSATCTWRGRPVAGYGRGRSKQDARHRAMEALLDALYRSPASTRPSRVPPPPAPPAPRRPAESISAPAAQRSTNHHVPAPAASRPAQPRRPVAAEPRGPRLVAATPTRTPRLPDGPTAPLAPWTPAPDPRAAGQAAALRALPLLTSLLCDGVALSWDPESATLLLYRPDVSALPDAPDAVTAVTADLVLESAPSVVTAVPAWSVPVALAATALTASTDPALLHASVHGWAYVTRAALALLAHGRAVPAIDEQQRDVWRLRPAQEWPDFLGQAARRLSPHAHCVAAGPAGQIRSATVAAAEYLHALTNAWITTPGTQALFPGPFTGAPSPQPAAVSAWADALTPTLAGPKLVLQIRLPARDEPRLYAHAVVEDDQVVADLSTPAGQHGLAQWRQAIAELEELAAVASGPLLVTDDMLVRLLGPWQRELSEQNIEIRWPEELVPTLASRPLLGSRVGFSLDELLVDCRWQLTVDGMPLTDEETAQISTAAAPILR